MQVATKEEKIPFTIDLLESVLDFEEFKHITWGLEPVDGVYYIRHSLAKQYGLSF